MPDRSVSPWPAGCRGAISLTFDDGWPTHLSKVVPILAESGLLGTFYLNPRGDDWLDRLAPWREVARAGHEVGNHTMKHRCSKALGDDPRAPCLESMTLAEVEADILESSRRLREAIPEQAAFTFCYPCYQEHVGEGLTRQSYVPLIARHFIAGRGGGEYGHNHPATCDLAYLFSWPVEYKTGHTLVGMAEQAAALGRWSIFTIHGIDEGHLPLSEAAFRELCRHLARSRESLWVAPVIEVARQIMAWRQGGSLEASQDSGGHNP
jgi:peptidoglycan/xylan/chitin deacetylase (PgdA/CDA1 family)